MGIKALYIGAYLGVLIGFTVQWSPYMYLRGLEVGIVYYLGAKVKTPIIS